MVTKQLFCLANFALVILMLAACEHGPEKLETPNMTPLTPRLQQMFEKTKTVCFGRFMVDVPASSRVVWGDTNVPYGVKVYPNGVDEVMQMGQKFIDELKREKAINHEDVPLLLSVNDSRLPEGKVVIGYEDYQAINGLKINGYFKLASDGVVINARPMSDEKDETISDITSMAQRLRQRTESEVPAEPGNCIEHAFLKDKPNPSEDDLLEHVRIGFRLDEFPDAHLSIYVAPSNPHDPQGDSLEAQWKRIVDEATPEEKKALEGTKFFRKGPRQIREWHTGFEVLTRAPDEEGSHSHHDFQARFIGMPNDALKPYADIQFQTGVDSSSAGATKASLTDEEAIAVWDKITSTIRVRPTSAAPVKTSEAGPGPHLLLGELAATGRICPQTGWWESDESRAIEGGRRQHIKAGERMPPVIALDEPSIWQKLKGERPSYRAATVWKLVGYDDAPVRSEITTPGPATAQASPGNNVAATDTGADPSESNLNKGTSPQKKG